MPTIAVKNRRDRSFRAVGVETKRTKQMDVTPDERGHLAYDQDPEKRRAWYQDLRDRLAEARRAGCVSIDARVNWLNKAGVRTAADGYWTSRLLWLLDGAEADLKRQAASSPKRSDRYSFRSESAGSAASAARAVFRT
jgi:hypothetical protein